MDYILTDNLLTKQKPNDRIARVVNVHSYTTADLADAIAKQNIGISKAEALAALEAADEIQLGWLAGGNAINRRLAHYHFSVPGTYESGEYPTDAAIRITASKELTEMAKTIPLRHVEPTGQIFIDFVHDTKSDSTNENVTVGGTVKITGYNLKIAGDDPSVGIEFVSMASPGVVYPVETVDLVINNPSELLVVTPTTMAVGDEVVVKVTTQYSHSKKLLKAPRSVTTVKTLSVI